MDDYRGTGEGWAVLTRLSMRSCDAMAAWVVSRKPNFNTKSGVFKRVAESEMTLISPFLPLSSSHTESLPRRDPTQRLPLGEIIRQDRSETRDHARPGRGGMFERALWVFDQVLAIDRH